MVDREQLKLEIDRVQDEYLEALQRIIEAFKLPSETNGRSARTLPAQEEDWQKFVAETAGAWQGEPLVRGEQGNYEQREKLL